MENFAKLTIDWFPQRPRDEITVIADGAPIPFEWIDYKTIQIDKVFVDRAQVVVTPRRRDVFKP